MCACVFQVYVRGVSVFVCAFACVSEVCIYMRSICFCVFHVCVCVWCVYVCVRGVRVFVWFAGVCEVRVYV